MISLKIIYWCRTKKNRSETVYLLKHLLMSPQHVKADPHKNSSRKAVAAWLHANNAATRIRERIIRKFIHPPFFIYSSKACIYCTRIAIGCTILQTLDEYIFVEVEVLYWEVPWYGVRSDTKKLKIMLVCVSEYSRKTNA